MKAIRLIGDVIGGVVMNIFKKLVSRLRVTRCANADREMCPPVDWARCSPDAWRNCPIRLRDEKRMRRMARKVKVV
jgi:hypothetical protein